MDGWKDGMDDQWRNRWMNGCIDRVSDRWMNGKSG